MKSRAVSTVYGKTRYLLYSASTVVKLHIKLHSTSKGDEGRVHSKSKLFKVAADIEERC